MKIGGILLFLFVVWSCACAQVNIPPDKEQLLKGETTGEIFIAEKNGYVSPQRILELKDELDLTKGQINKIDEMLRILPVSATVKGQEIVEAEEDLNTLFALGTMNEKMLRKKLENVGMLRAALRFTHLQVYLKAKQILSSNQWYRLKELQARESK
jgi:Spy/CpxP family protein refolding chaperone